jgi:hypothetical protein
MRGPKKRATARRGSPVLPFGLLIWWSGALGYSVVLQGFLLRVAPRRWHPPGHPIQHDAAPAALGELAVVVATLCRPADYADVGDGSVAG